MSFHVHSGHGHSDIDRPDCRRREGHRLAGAGLRSRGAVIEFVPRWCCNSAWQPADDHVMPCAFHLTRDDFAVSVLPFNDRVTQILYGRWFSGTTQIGCPQAGCSRRTSSAVGTKTQTLPSGSRSRCRSPAIRHSRSAAVSITPSGVVF